MEPMEILRMFAALLTVLGAIMVALNYSPHVTVAGFAVFTAAALAWMVDGWIESRASLFFQNLVLLMVNIAGIYRWLPRT